MTTNYAGPPPPARAPGRAGAQPPESLAPLLPDLTVDEKALLLTGADSWRTQGAEALGLRPMIMSDGPAGVRGVVLDERQPSSSLPCPSALGATWDPELVRELAAALGREARGKAVDVLLGPRISLMRAPAGVAGTVKHSVGNDSETQRWTYDARIAEHVLRELYLFPFEAAVKAGGALAGMAAYRGVQGARLEARGR